MAYALKAAPRSGNKRVGDQSTEQSINAISRSARTVQASCDDIKVNWNSPR